MPDAKRVAIADYGMGNLFSVQLACEHVGLSAGITPDPAALDSADAVVLPGVGAFGDAMQALRARGLADALVRAAREGRPVFGICLGLQLLMERSLEFGEHEGLGLVPGDVVKLDAAEDGRALKVPEVCWNRAWRTREDAWQGTPLEGTPDGVYQYFVHSYVVRPSSADAAVAVTRYGDAEFCSAVSLGNVFACQFHPERSGPDGIRIYERFAAIVRGA